MIQDLHLFSRLNFKTKISFFRYRSCIKLSEIQWFYSFYQFVPMELAQQKVASSAMLKAKSTDLAFAKCDCCGLTEECTEDYIKRVCARYSGRWICGLCAEAVKDELLRSEDRIGNEEAALNQHMSFCKKFRALSPPKNPTEELISAVKQLLFKSLDSPGRASPKKSFFVRSESCFPALDA